MPKTGQFSAIFEILHSPWQNNWTNHTLSGTHFGVQNPTLNGTLLENPTLCGTEIAQNIKHTTYKMHEIWSRFEPWDTNTSIQAMIFSKMPTKVYNEATRREPTANVVTYVLTLIQAGSPTNRPGSDKTRDPLVRPQVDQTYRGSLTKRCSDWIHIWTLINKQVR